MNDQRLSKAEYRIKRRTERTKAKTDAQTKQPQCRGCGVTLPGAGVCASCYHRGVR